MAGFFISFEGGEGAGKTTQIGLLSKALQARGHTVLCTREPGGTPEAEKIRDLLVKQGGGVWHPEAELLLLFAARKQHVEHLIRPALTEGHIVITDRFTDSTRAYQGAGQGIDPEKIERLNTLVLGNFAPDLTFVLDMDPAAGLVRARDRLARETPDSQTAEDRFERLDLSFHERLRAGFLEIARKSPHRCVVLSAAQAQTTLSAEIEAQVMGRLEG